MVGGGSRPHRSNVTTRAPLRFEKARRGAHRMEPTTLSTLFGAAERGERPAAEALFGALYDELHRMARRELARHAGPVSVGATTLLHQAYIAMAAREGPDFPDRGRFMAYAARVMRGLIIDHARQRCAQKRGGLFEITALPGNVADNPADDKELTRIGDALDELAKTDSDLAEIVDFKTKRGGQ